MKKKILLVTLFDEHNIGNRLQNYALQQILKRYNAEVTTLDNGYTKTLSKKDWVKIHIKRILGILGNKQYRKEYQKYAWTKCLETACREFDKRNLSHICKTDNLKVFQQNWDSYDLAIAGSDQIWHKWRDDSQELPYYYLQFMPHQKRFAYAASFGFETFPQEDINQHVEGLKQMKAISCREKSGCELAEKILGCKVPHVLDPTLLLSAQEWRELEKQGGTFVRKQTKYVLVYFLGAVSQEYKDYIEKIKREASIYKTIDFTDRNELETVKNGPAGFLALVDNADFVFTDSFHCTVFSVLFDKKLTVFKRIQPGFEKMFDRIEEFLSSVNRLECVYGEKTKRGTNDFAIMKQQSFQYIETVLNISEK